MIKRFLLAVALLFPCWAFAQCVDCADTAGYVEVTIPAIKVDEAVPFGYLPMSKLPEGFHLGLDAASDTTGATIRIETEDAGAECALWVPSYNASTDEGAILWRLTGLSSSVDTVYRVHVVPGVSMYAASATYGRNAVFAGYAGFYFPGVTLDDVTGNGYGPLTAEGSPGTTASAWEGIPAATYNGSSQYHSYSGTQAVTDWPITSESIALSTNIGTLQSTIALANTSGDSSSAGLFFGGTTSGDPIRYVVAGTNGTTSDARSSTAYSASTYYYLAGSRDDDSGKATVYLDAGGVVNNTTTIVAPSFNSLAIGARLQSTANSYVSGSVTAAYLSDSARPAAYVATMQAMWTDPGFVDVGEWVEAGGGCVSGTTGWVLLQSAISSGTGTVWSNPTNVLIDDATYALADNVEGYGGLTQALVVTDPLYGVTIPSGADSYQASLRIKRSAQSGSRRIGEDNNVRFVVGGAPTGSNMAIYADWPNSPGTVDYGPVSFNESDLDQDFGFQLVGVANDRDDTDLFVYTAWVKIDWECGDDATLRTIGFFGPLE